MEDTDLISQNRACALQKEADQKQIQLLQQQLVKARNKSKEGNELMCVRRGLSHTFEIGQTRPTCPDEVFQQRKQEKTFDNES